jgi:hypothetical protein
MRFLHANRYPPPDQVRGHAFPDHAPECFPLARDKPRIALLSLEKGEKSALRVRRSDEQLMSN